MSKTKQTFLPYGAGIPPGRLRIGHMCMDPYNAEKGNEDVRFPFKKDEFPALKKASQKPYEEFIEEYTGEPDEYSTYAQTFSATGEWFAKFNLLNVLSGDFSNTKTFEASIDGQNGRRFEVYEPQAFFENVVLQQPGAREWIRNMLSSTAKGKMSLGDAASSGIWVCTGVVHVQKGSINATNARSKTAQATFNADPGTLSSGIPTGASLGQIGAGANGASHVELNYEQKHDRIWAAQWQEIKVKYGPRTSIDGEKPLLIKLKQIEGRKDGFRGMQSGTMSTAAGNVVAEIVGLAPPEVSPLRTPNNEILIDETPYRHALEHFDEGVLQHNLEIVRHTR